MPGLGSCGLDHGGWEQRKSENGKVGVEGSFFLLFTMLLDKRGWTPGPGERALAGGGEAKMLGLGRTVVQPWCWLLVDGGSAGGGPEGEALDVNCFHGPQTSKAGNRC